MTMTQRMGARKRRWIIVVISPIILGKGKIFCWRTLKNRKDRNSLTIHKIFQKRSMMRFKIMIMISKMKIESIIYYIYINCKCLKYNLFKLN